jgi:hypothetical protein
VTITSAARAISSVQGFGYSAEMSMPTSAHRGDRSRVRCVAGIGPAGENIDRVAGQVPQPAGRHLRAAGVVHAEEQDGRPALGASET